MQQNIPEIFKSEDTVYHYCPTLTAIEHILFEKKLRFSLRKKPIDPLENATFNYPPIGGYNNPKEQNEINERTEETRKIIKQTLKFRDNNTKQLCFCKNKAIEGNLCQSTLQEEYYGFLKPRMWDQYGDNYRGTCLAFSRKKLLEIHKHEADDVEYVHYNLLNFNQIDINLNQLVSESFENEYLQNRLQKQKKNHFRKHIDYAGECEFRMLSLSNEEFDYIDISKALVGIIVSVSGISSFSKDWFNNYSKKHNIELRYIEWRKNGISILTQENLEIPPIYIKEIPKEISASSNNEKQ